MQNANSASDNKKMIRRLTSAAILMAFNVIFSSSVLSVPVPGGHMYLNDMVVVMASALLDPISAILVSGIGAFLGDLIFYPAPMFVSLVTHALQAAAISFIIIGFKKMLGEKREFIGAIVGAAAGAVINVAGYTIGRAYFYSTYVYAVQKFPFQVLQAVAGSAIGVVICYPLRLKAMLKKANLIV